MAWARSEVRDILHRSGGNLARAAELAGLTRQRVHQIVRSRGLASEAARLRGEASLQRRVAVVRAMVGHVHRSLQVVGPAPGGWLWRCQVCEGDVVRKAHQLPAQGCRGLACRGYVRGQATREQAVLLALAQRPLAYGEVVHLLAAPSRSEGARILARLHEAGCIQRVPGPRWVATRAGQTLAARLLALGVAAPVLARPPRVTGRYPVRAPSSAPRMVAM
jgi:hypothetical protein